MKLAETTIGTESEAKNGKTEAENGDVARLTGCCWRCEKDGASSKLCGRVDRSAVDRMLTMRRKMGSGVQF